MNRRDILKILAFGFIGLGMVPESLAKNAVTSPVALPTTLDDHIKDYLHKMRHFNEHHKDDVQIESVIYKTFNSVVLRLRRLQQVAGHGNFQLLSFDDGLSIARKYSHVGEFTKAEIRFLEILFYSEASRYGFFGKKPLKKLTDRVKKTKVVKIPSTGNYVYKGQPLETYEKIKQHLGEQVILTSGIRGVMKQFLLFLNKAYMSDGNLSLASRSLAPPGYSFHGNGDFDVGQSGLGSDNFTTRFATTKVYDRLCDLGYLKLRYPEQNLLGVRYEPWHIKVYPDV